MEKPPEGTPHGTWALVSLPTTPGALHSFTLFTLHSPLASLATIADYEDPPPAVFGSALTYYRYLFCLTKYRQGFNRSRESPIIPDPWHGDHGQ
ncbi:hypothetical protein ASPBRDRAFT_36283 [Aspergillus brasiliensis CBS 101740]|uniref:Uncharacterized protein n=1 Tax=Aspergillus brasiliensis (strain CBS 101740 / IMI 381727 / IBT 21946) TaxID=767769 RepID=A0A1L9UZK0_ASPBC|nr:hypothetical protein ASPBRDRAFT_36283 [Aspergillus brasiliensis CBS 101740]